ncbi:hypothetical protein FRB93_006780 [Tulasnella sp. JGI-2019a]|nr:hypothetical protein FRB93_006780 [Tulasnella sp. JGI-2019a]
MASIVRLAPELILSISKYLSVTEAVLFLSCCRYLHSITENRHFWLNLAQYMWSRYNIPHSTCDLSAASTLELRRTVARPYRFQRAIIKKNLTRRSPVKLERPNTGLKWIGFGCMEAILIPGGRWLVTLSEGYGNDEPMSAVVVYDIRMPAEKNFAVVAHSFLHLEQASYSSITVAPDPAGLGFMVFVQIIHVNPVNKFSLVAYKLDPLQPATLALERVASLEMLDQPAYIGPLRVAGTLLAHLYTEQKLFIWDWANGRYGVYQGDYNIIVLDAVLVTIEEDGALLVDNAQPEKMIKLSWLESPIEEHLKSTSDPLVIETPAVPMEAEFLVSDLRSSLDSRHLVISSKDWPTTAQPRSLFISDQSHGKTLLVDIVPQVPGFVTRVHPISFVDGGDRPIFHGKTISGHVLACDEKGGVTTLLSGGSTYQVLERDIDRQGTSTQVPFMCSVSGTFGFMGRGGQIFVWQQK